MLQMIYLFFRLLFIDKISFVKVLFLLGCESKQPLGGEA